MTSGDVGGTATQTLDQAVAHLNEGRARQAEVLVRQVLQAEPDNHAAVNLLGMIALNTGHASEAVEILSHAVQLQRREAEYHSNLAVALLSTNRAVEGEAALLAALQLKPAHAMANFNLGLLSLQNGRFEDARRSLEKAVRRMPHNPAALNALGVAHSKCGKPAKAVPLFRSVLEMQPGDLDTQLNLAGALTEMGKAAEAITQCEALIEAHPGQGRLYFILAVALSAAKRGLDAAEAYEQAIALEPEFIDAHVNLSALYAERGDQDAALEHAGIACALRPGDVHLMINEARFLRDGGLGGDALAACDRILALEPGNAEALGIRITVLQNDGRFDEARDLGAEIDALPLLLALSQDADFTFSDQNIRRLKDAATDNATDSGAAARAWFALGKIHHNRGEYDTAFDYIARGNRLRNSAYDWSQADEDALLATWKDTFTADSLKANEGMGRDSERPVFIVGMLRSGTTLVEQIIASHKDAAGAGELSDIQIMADKLARGSSSGTPYPACLKELDSATADALAAQYLERLDRVSSTVARVTDKMPGNAWHLGLISRLFPKARVIHCHRDPMATCFSIYQQIFPGYHPYAYDLAKLGRRQRNHARLMDHWRKILPLPILEVGYEDLVADQEGQSRRILEFCGLDWDARVLDFHQTPRNVQTASLWQVRQPIYTAAVEGWRAYEKFLGPLQEALSAD